jgi:hypothetical protein
VKVNERNRNRYGSGRLRLWIYSIVFALGLVPIVIEVKTGIPIGRGRESRATHDSRSWDEVWTELLEPEWLPLYASVIAVIVVLAELFFRFGKTQEDQDQDAGDGLADAPAKRFTRPWLLITGAYTVLLIALYVLAGSDWAGGMPLPTLSAPLAALSPIVLSLAGLAIYTGEIWIRYGKIYRRRSPLIFWMLVSIALLLGIAMFLAGISS